MFKKFPKVLAHSSALKNNHFITEEYILTKTNKEIKAFNRECPHRLYPIGEKCGPSKKIICKFHGFEFDSNGMPLNNDKKLRPKNISFGNSGLIFQDFVEPNTSWISDLSKEKNLQYSHSYFGESKGSYLWQMDAEADMLHVRKDGIHPWLSKQVNSKYVALSDDKDWILQTHPDGWWLYIFPLTFIEWSPKCLSINLMTPNKYDSQWGFSWMTQMYFDPTLSKREKNHFDKVEMVWKEDIATIEKIKHDYFPNKNKTNSLEEHCIVFGEWVINNKQVLN